MLIGLDRLMPEILIQTKYHFNAYEMRARKVRTAAKSVQALKTNVVDDNVMQTCPDIPVRVTRNLQKLLYNFQDFIILESYRCMPLLGDEDKVPNWDVHIVRFSIMYINNEKVDNKIFDQNRA